jgi:hypothetical protein
MIGQLCAEPAVYCRDQAQIRGSKGDLSAIRQLRIFNPEFSRTFRKLSYAGHVRTMQRGRIGKIASPESHCFMSKVLSDESNLLFVVFVSGNHLLDAAAFRHFKNMLSLAQIERHYIPTHFVHHGLLVLMRRSGAPRKKNHARDNKNRKEKAVPGSRWPSSLLPEHSRFCIHFSSPLFELEMIYSALMTF